MMRCTFLSLAEMLVMALGCKDESTPSSTSSPPAPQVAPVPTDARTGPPTTVPAGGAAMTDATAKANELLQQGLSYVNENKLDLAEKALAQLEGMRSQLPAEWGPRIEQLRTAINTAKVGSKLPGMGR